MSKTKAWASHTAMLLGVVVVLLVTGPCLTGEPLPQSVLIAVHIRSKATETFKEHASFTCLETIERSERKSSSSPFVAVDALRLEVAIVDGKELFSWPGDRSFSEHAPKELVAAGLTSSGESLANVRNVLLSNNAILTYSGTSELHRTGVLQYGFSLSELVYGYRVYGRGQSAIVATKGTIWVNAETLELVRLELATASIPAALGIASITSATDFAPSNFSGERMLLPSTATVTLTETNGRTSRNKVFFSHFRRYSAESDLSFPDEASRLQTEPHPVPPGTYLPAGLNLSLQLTTSIDVGRARIGDPIRCVLLADVKSKNSVVFPRGSIATGRVRLAELLKSPKPHLLLGIEFTNIASSQSEALMLAFLTSYTNLPVLDTSMKEESTRTASLMNRGRLTVTDSATTFPLNLPGVGTFIVTDLHATIPAGFQMDWISLKPAKREYQRR